MKGLPDILPAGDALTGCDTISHLLEFGKGTALKVVIDRNHLTVLFQIGAAEFYLITEKIAFIAT